ncbi:MAG TPA: Holliday junction resolvase Hjc [Candidatus Nanoarchaeia archaeon]|nr:Holliday junction resolvase Hjc [Candidatus Nanoarchaeia archaeon]
MSRKSKGINAERELIKLFWETRKWLACRVAGSGVSRYPCPDIIAGKIGRKIAIECKASKDDMKYIPRDDIFKLKEFALTFEAEPWVAVRFDRTPWYFLRVDELEDTGTTRLVSKKMAEEKGLTFEQLVAENGVNSRTH